MFALSAHDPSTKNLDLDAVRRLYGSGLAMTIMTERRLAAAAGGRYVKLLDAADILETLH